MGWFDEQIRQRKQRDEEVFAESMLEMADAVLGSRMAAALSDNRKRTKDAIDEILKFYHVKSREIPDSITDLNEQLGYPMEPYGIMRRNIVLEEGWYKDACGAMLATKKDGTVIALIPSGFAGYDYLDPETGRRVKVGKQTESLIDKEALCFYKPLPMKRLTIADLIAYILGVLSPMDYALVVLSTMAVTLVGMLLPMLNNILFEDIIQRGSYVLLAAMAISFICVTISSALIGSIKTLLLARVNTKLDITVESATMTRVLALPATFFKTYGSGELAARTQYMNSLCSLIVDAALTTGLSGVFSLAYLGQISAYAPALVIPALAVIAVTTVFSIVSGIMQASILKKEMDVATKENGMSYALITGIQKVKLAGAEKRMFGRWAKLYAKQAQLQYDPPLLIKLNSVISTGISLVGTIAIYSAALTSGVGLADYYAFNVAYGMLSGAFMQLAGIALTAARVRPILEMVNPLLESVPEIAQGKTVISRVSGAIELNNVSFRYSENMPMVIDNLSLKIKPGQYVAIVGTTGCGKSTLMRLMLGFETPQKGAIYYDGKDLSGIDLKSLRRRIGTVMQNGGLFTGDLYSNITISAPWLTLNDAWEAAELAGIADDIRNMPMGMNTMISEGQGGGVSGGQKQRLMIARAIAAKPKILMFDEATSALDNITQKQVSQSLDGLKCTRIVIAHRLSTIRNCDRIIVLDKGKIIEDGSYEELIAQGGFFAELVERQRVE